MVDVTTSGVRLTVGDMGVIVESAVTVIVSVAVGVARESGARERATRPTQ
jgi:hypothetical protein